MLISILVKIDEKELSRTIRRISNKIPVERFRHYTNSFDGLFLDHSIMQLAKNKAAVYNQRVIISDPRGQFPEQNIAVNLSSVGSLLSPLSGSSRNYRCVLDL